MPSFILILIQNYKHTLAQNGNRKSDCITSLFILSRNRLLNYAHQFHLDKSTIDVVLFINKK